MSFFRNLLFVLFPLSFFTLIAAATNISDAEEPIVILVPKEGHEHKIEVPYKIALMSPVIKNMIEDLGGKDALANVSDGLPLMQISAPILKLVMQNLTKMKAMDRKTFKILKKNIEESLPKECDKRDYYEHFYLASIYLEIEDDFLIAAAAALVDKNLKYFHIEHLEEELSKRMDAYKFAKYFPKYFTYKKSLNKVKLKLAAGCTISHIEASNNELYVFSKNAKSANSASRVTRINALSNEQEGDEVIIGERLKKVIAENNTLFLFLGNQETVLQKIQWHDGRATEIKKPIYISNTAPRMLFKNNKFYFPATKNGVVSINNYSLRPDAYANYDVEIKYIFKKIGDPIINVLFSDNTFFIVSKTIDEGYYLSLVCINTKKVVASFKLEGNPDEVIDIGNKIYLTYKNNNDPWCYSGMPIKAGISVFDILENNLKFIPYDLPFSKIVVSGTNLCILDDDTIKIFDTISDRVVRTVSIGQHSNEIVSINSILYILNKERNAIMIFNQNFDPYLNRSFDPYFDL